MPDRYSAYLTRLKRICRAKRFRLETIGWTGPDGTLPILQVTIRWGAKNPRTLCVVGGVHGNETSGPAAVLAFIKSYSPRPDDPRIVLLPVANPTGFAADTYRDYRRRNYNRSFGGTDLIPECRALLDAAKRAKPHVFMSLHEDDELESAYLYGYSSPGRTDKVYRDILRAVERHCRINNRQKIYKNKADHGLILDPPSDGSFEDRMHQEKIPYSVCLEIPDRIPERSRVDAALAAILAALESCRTQS